MGNILSYLKWRGDLTLTERPFNEIDNLVLAALSYMDLEGVVPEIGKEGFITVADASVLYFSDTKEIDVVKSKRLSVVDPALLKEMAVSKRFCKAKLSQYMDIMDEINLTQFAAVQIELDDGTIYISYRGTDNSVIGWREDFTISFQTVPAQESALMYLQSIAIGNQKKYRIGGHSKGGNLAMYASMMCEDSIQKQIIEVYNNDGPGFCPDMPWALQYKKIKEKTMRIIPAFSVIGTLFEQDTPHKIVDSSVKGLLQHDIMTWEIVGSELIEKKELTRRCLLLNEIFSTWIENVDMEHRKTFTKDFFDALSAGGANVMTDIANGGVDGFESILYAIIKSDTQTKTVIGKFIDSVFNNSRKIDFRVLIKKKPR